MKKSFLYLALFAAFAMVFASCSKKDDSSSSSSNNNGGGGATEYEILISNSIEHGIVTASETSAFAGTTITLTAIPEEGYMLHNYDVYLTNDSLTKVPVVDNTFEMPVYDVTVFAEFIPLDYGTITVNGQEYTIKKSAYEAYFDEDLHTNVVAIVLADKLTEDANLFSVMIPYVETIPTDTFTYCMQNTIPEGMCTGVFQASNNRLICMDGNITISELNGIYRIVSAGTATDMEGLGLEISFNVDFEGPLTEVK